MSDGNKNNGIGLIGLLTILFIGLKLTGFIEWSWVWVLSPIWITGAVLLVLVIIWAIIEEINKI